MVYLKIPTNQLNSPLFGVVWGIIFTCDCLTRGLEVATFTRGTLLSTGLILGCLYSGAGTVMCSALMLRTGSKGCSIPFDR